MKRKLSKSGSPNCSAVAAKKNNSSQLEWGAVFSGAFRWLMNIGSAVRFYEFLKTLIEHGCSSG